MTFEMYVWEREMKARAEERAEALAEGIETGRAEKLFQVVKNFLFAKTPIEYIKAATGWSEEKILQFEKNLNKSDEISN